MADDKPPVPAERARRVAKALANVKPGLARDWLEAILLYGETSTVQIRPAKPPETPPEESKPKKKRRKADA